MRSAFALSLPVALLFSATAVAVVPLLFGQAYKGAAIVLTILVWKIPLTACGTPYGAVLIARGRQVALMRNNLIAGGLTVAADLIAIPFFGIVGAAVVGVGSAAIATFLNHRTCVREGLGPSLSQVLRRRRSPTSAAPAQ